MVIRQLYSHTVIIYKQINTTIVWNFQIIVVICSKYNTSNFILLSKFKVEFSKRWLHMEQEIYSELNNNR